MQVFSLILAQLILILKTLRSIEFTTWPDESGVELGDSSRAGRDGIELDGRKIDGDEFDNSEVIDNKVGERVQKLSKSKKMIRLDFFIFKVKLIFTKLKQAYVEALIFHHFNPEPHIQIETNISGYTIDRVFS